MFLNRNIVVRSIFDSTPLCETATARNKQGVIFMKQWFVMSLGALVVIAFVSQHSVCGQRL